MTDHPKSRETIRMKFTVFNVFLSAGSLLLPACTGHPDTPGHDDQVLQIYLHTGYHDDIDTFSGYLQKDLVPGTARIPFWFTSSEQQIILTKLQDCQFFSFPDTIYPQPDVYQSPNFGAQVIRAKYSGKDKTVVWYEPPQKSFKEFPLLVQIRQLIYDIVRSRPDYKSLPERKGLYL